jgi:hypothetical protein
VFVRCAERLSNRQPDTRLAHALVHFSEPLFSSSLTVIRALVFLISYWAVLTPAYAASITLGLIALFYSTDFPLLSSHVCV